MWFYLYPTPGDKAKSLFARDLCGNELVIEKVRRLTQWEGIFYHQQHKGGHIAAGLMAVIR
jgi:hypothetical protein